MLILLEFLFFIDLLLVKKLLLNKIFKIRYHSKENIERALIKNMNNFNLYIIHGCMRNSFLNHLKKSNMVEKNGCYDKMILGKFLSKYNNFEPLVSHFKI